ncbi:unnamed protein product [Fraxinus pennsylvanica]|uniref:14-3-3 domain-containing protein n=1 Tax=Fraxinus pennsylvanica TaxID=56036 RepID=A0AAD1YN51_9LAMI|nr:unnamed protein product [Fraxinus pennsylvanica]
MKQPELKWDCFCIGRRIGCGLERITSVEPVCLPLGELRSDMFFTQFQQRMSIPAAPELLITEPPVSISASAARTEDVISFSDGFYPGTVPVHGQASRILNEYLIPSVASSESKVFYLKMKGDYYRYLAEFKAGNESKEVGEDTVLAYKTAQPIVSIIGRKKMDGICFTCVGNSSQTMVFVTFHLNIFCIDLLSKLPLRDVGTSHLLILPPRILYYWV